MVPQLLQHPPSLRMALRLERSLLSFASDTTEEYHVLLARASFFTLAMDVHPWYIFCHE